MPDALNHRGYPGFGSHSYQQPMSVADSVAAHFRREAEIKARQEREAEAQREKILARCSWAG